MATIDLYWQEAGSAWDLLRLYRDFSQVKGKTLTNLQKAELRAALCSRDLHEVAQRLNRKLNGFRTNLSRGLYRLVEQLLWEKRIQHDGKMYWVQIPHLLELAGYRQCPASDIQAVLASISTPPLSIRAASIIDAIETQRLQSRQAQISPDFPMTQALAWEHEGDLAWQQGQATNAINCYRVPVEQDASYTGMLVKIAMVFDRLGLYEDAVAIALATQSLSATADQLSKLNGILGSAFHELALHTLDDLILKQALNYYKESIFRSTEINVLGAFNSFELLLKFHVEKPDKFFNATRLALGDFKDLVGQPQSNFTTYKDKICNDIKLIRPQIQDPWLIKELKQIEKL